MKKKQKAAVGKPKPQKDRQTPEKAGLTFSEKKRLAELKRILAGNSREQAKPDTAQKTITFKKMYRDGICQVTDAYYTKMVEFFDINYDLLEVEDQADILEEYSKLINYFDPSIKFQLFLFNRQVSEQALAEQFDIALQGDAFDDIRDEYTQMLKHQSAKGNNGIIKSKYLIFGVESVGYREAKSKLNNIEKDVVHNLNNIGTNARGLDGKERLRILHEYFNQGTMEPFRFSFKELSESGKSVKDYIAPPGFDFRYPSRFKSGSIYGSVSYLDMIAPKFTDEMIKKLLDIDDNLTLTMHMQTIDPVEAIKMIKRALTDIQKMKIEEQKKAVRSGYDMDILPTDIVTYEKDTLELLDDLNTSNQKLIKMTFLITCYGRTKRELENLIQRVSGIIQQANCNLRCLQYLQEQGLMASAPIGCNDVGIERNLTTKSAAVLVPFCTQELFMPAPAIYYGLNALSNNMIMAERKRLRTPNGVILGTPGSGKSFSAKREILSCFLITKDDIIICDPEGEYFPLVQALHGQVVKLSTNSKDFLNPMDIQLSHKGDKEALKLKSDFLITLCDLIAGGKNGLENDEKGIIDTCILLNEKYSVEVAIKEPTVIYLERPRKEAHYTIHIEVPPNPFWASIGLAVTPLPVGSGTEYESKVSLGYLNQSFQNAVIEGIRYGLEQGVYGWEVTDCRVCFEYGVYYSPVSTPADFRFLAPVVLEQVLKKAGTQVLEPYLSFTLFAPQEYLSRAYHDAVKYDAVIETTSLKNNEAILTGEIPARRIGEYKSDLNFYTNGRSVCLTELKGYQETSGEPVVQPRRPNSRLDKVRHMFQKIM